MNLLRRLTVLAAAILFPTFVIAGLDPATHGSSGLTIHATPLSSFTPFPQLTRFGKLEWRGGLVLSSGDPRFGGLSGLALSRDGSQLLAVSDRGFWLKARLVYNGGRLANVIDPQMAPILDSAGRPGQSKVQSDAEALSLWEPGNITGKVIVGFESRTRAGAFDLAKGFTARFQNLKLPAEAAKGPPNQELESIGRFAAGPLKGSLIAISEGARDRNGDIRAWIWGGKRRFAFAIKQYEDYAITDLAILPDGDIVTVERSFGTSLLPGMAVRRFPSGDIVAGGAVSPVLVFAGRAPMHSIDNMEGIAAFTNAQGETIVTLISDNNFNATLQRTLLLQFALH